MKYCFGVRVLASLLLLALFPSCLMANVLDAGVSKRLAETRANVISNVEYSIDITIVDDIQKDIHGEVSVCFEKNDDSDLVLDFCGKQLKNEGLVNGSQRKVSFANEHIVIPGKWLRRGRNEVRLSFVAADSYLNWNADYLYTLFVPDHARSMFPCFDQPDLKAKYSLTLKMPDTWTAISTGKSKEETVEGRVKTMKFDTTPPIPTYLFSFTAGAFRKATAECDGLSMTALYRETDEKKVAQLDTIFSHVAFAVRWLEEYTGMKMPFPKYDLAIIPGYQFGGMEHPGAIQYLDRTMFLGNEPTQEEELKRFELLAHETAHLWFGDMVTMRWFDDVWTKEVFANFFAAKMCKEKYPHINQDISFLKMYQSAALSTDRTQGTHPIQQPLDNLNSAGLLYGNIIYDKAPVMMRKMEQLIGKEDFKKGIREYLRTFAYLNATWDELVDILHRANPSAQVKLFSHVWVKEKGMPYINVRYENNKIVVSQTDPWGRGLVWPQTLKIGVVSQPKSDSCPLDIDTLTVELLQQCHEINCKEEPWLILPNLDGYGYGKFVVAQPDAKKMESIYRRLSDTGRIAVLMTLYENGMTPWRLAIDDDNQLISSLACSYLYKLLRDMNSRDREESEAYLLSLCNSTGKVALHQSLARLLSAVAMSPNTIAQMYEVWNSEADTLLNARDYMAMSYRLALMMPEKHDVIVDRQGQRLKSEDLRREYDFVSRGCNPDLMVQDSLFYGLRDVSNRRIEPWTCQLLKLLTDETRMPKNAKYVIPALELVEEIRETGGIFFPANWLNALLVSQRSPKVRQAVEQFLDAHPHFPVALRNKLLEAASNLF